MKDYIQSNLHRYGIIGAIIGCLLCLLGWITWSWYWVVISFYVLGLAIYLVKVLIESSHSNEIIDVTPESPILNSTSTYNAPIHQQLLTDFNDLEKKAKSQLNFKSRQLMQEIDDIMQFMSNKIKSSDNQMFKFEISDIQRTMTSYLSPALENFCRLPTFLRDRKIENLGKTPHELLEQQLQMILEELKKIAESIYINDLNQIIDHGQFLKQKLQQDQFFKTNIEPR